MSGAGGVECVVWLNVAKEERGGGGNLCVIYNSCCVSAGETPLQTKAIKLDVRRVDRERVLRSNWNLNSAPVYVYNETAAYL